MPSFSIDFATILPTFITQLFDILTLLIIVTQFSIFTLFSKKTSFDLYHYLFNFYPRSG